jgi:hypothetical protein
VGAIQVVHKARIATVKRRYENLKKGIIQRGDKVRRVVQVVGQWVSAHLLVATQFFREAIGEYVL